MPFFDPLHFFWSTPSTSIFRPTPRNPKFYGPTLPTPKFQPAPPTSSTPKFYGPTPESDPYHQQNHAPTLLTSPKTHAADVSNEHTLCTLPTLFSRLPLEMQNLIKSNYDDYLCATNCLEREHYTFLSK